jgi:glyceraldehyde-3-phosphate dehydrogenase type II
MKDYYKQAIEEIKKEVGDKKVLLALSGGVDSSVAAVLLSHAIGKNLTCVYVDHGFMRKNETEEIVEALEKRSRVMVVSAEEGLGSTAELMEYAKELGRNRNDLYEIPVWRESINVVGNELFYMQAVHQESDVIPENIDAIRALLEMESDNEKSIAKTNKAMGIF